MIPLIIAAALGAVLLIGYTLVLLGVRQEERNLHLPPTPPSLIAAFARRVLGCRVYHQATNDAWTTPPRPEPSVPTGRATLPGSR